MDCIPNLWSTEEMKRHYGDFYERSPNHPLDGRRVPERFLPLLPYAEFWGIPDDWKREDLVKYAPYNVQQNLKEVVAAYDTALDEWLAGPEAESDNPSNEYVAFSAMRMAAYYV